MKVWDHQGVDLFLSCSPWEACRTFLYSPSPSQSLPFLPPQVWSFTGGRPQDCIVTLAHCESPPSSSTSFKQQLLLSGITSHHLPQPSRVRSVAFSPDGALLCTGEKVAMVICNHGGARGGARGGRLLTRNINVMRGEHTVRG